jgi:hypothetical protein
MSLNPGEASRRSASGLLQVRGERKTKARLTETNASAVVVAFPAKWGDCGVMTFIANQKGIVFEKNLGPDTTSIARGTTIYNPDRSWKIAQP